MLFAKLLNPNPKAHFDNPPECGPETLINDKGESIDVESATKTAPCITRTSFSSTDMTCSGEVNVTTLIVDEDCWQVYFC